MKKSFSSLSPIAIPLNGQCINQILNHYFFGNGQNEHQNYAIYNANISSDAADALKSLSWWWSWHSQRKLWLKMVSISRKIPFCDLKGEVSFVVNHLVSFANDFLWLSLKWIGSELSTYWNIMLSILSTSVRPSCQIVPFTFGILLWSWVAQFRHWLKKSKKGALHTCQGTWFKTTHWNISWAWHLLWLVGSEHSGIDHWHKGNSLMAFDSHMVILMGNSQALITGR